MCGPYVALCAARLAPAPAGASPGFGVRLLFNAGRLATYVAIGALVGAFGQIALAAGASARLGGIVALAAGAFAVLFGVSLLGWIRDPAGILSRLGIDVADPRRGSRGLPRTRLFVSDPARSAPGRFPVRARLWGGLAGGRGRLGRRRSGSHARIRARYGSCDLRALVVVAGSGPPFPRLAVGWSSDCRRRGASDAPRARRVGRRATCGALVALGNGLLQERGGSSESPAPDDHEIKGRFSFVAR